MKVAFVIPWYGNIPGGAESECRETVLHLADSGVEVEVLTTCVKEFLSDWSDNFYKEGMYHEDGILVRRFPVRKRNTALFNEINFNCGAGVFQAHSGVISSYFSSYSGCCRYPYISAGINIIYAYEGAGTGT